MTAATATVLKMMESLPEPVQEQVLERLREYNEDVRDEMKWNELFAGSQDKLIAAARKARASEGKDSDGS